MRIFGVDISLINEAKKRKDPVAADISKKVEVDDRAENYLYDVMEMSKIESLHVFRKIAQDRLMQYDEYDRIAEDIVISSALEMYADDACQFDAEGKIVWIESKSKKVKDYANNLLEVLNIPQKLWTMAYSLSKYGEQYIETFTKDEIAELMGDSKVKKHDNAVDKDKKTHNLGEAKALQRMTEEGDGKTEQPTSTRKGLVQTIEICDSPESLFDLQEFGKTIGFVRIQQDKKRNQQEEIVVYPPQKFVHMYLQKPSSRKLEVFEAQLRGKDNQVYEKEFKVIRGKSMIHDIYQIQQIIQLLEDSLILNRLSKSSIIRLLSVEVGDMPRGEVRKLLQRIKSKLEQKININVETGAYGTHNSPGPIDNMIFLPTRSGKGAIQHDSVGGDVDVRSIVDIDYFVNKKFGGLKIPKQYLGFDEAMPGMGSGLSLTKMDARYGRTIKRIQTALIRGITALVNYYLIDHDMQSEVNNFTVRMVAPTTVEDAEREEILQNRVQIGSSFMMLMNELPGVDKEKLVDFLADYIMREPAIKGMIDKEKLRAEEAGEEEDGEEF